MTQFGRDPDSISGGDIFFSFLWFKFVASIPFDFTVNTFDSLVAYDKPSRRVRMLSVFFMPKLSFTAKTTTKMTTSGSLKSTLSMRVIFDTAFATAFVTALDFHFSTSSESAFEKQSR
jgi:hypothetical protein